MTHTYQSVFLHRYVILEILSLNFILRKHSTPNLLSFLKITIHKGEFLWQQKKRQNVI